jgi:hypothetical protein
LSIATLAWAVIGMTVAAVLLPVTEWDACAIWMLKAKVLTTHALSDRPVYFSDSGFSYSHHQYPPLFPMLSAGFLAAGGSLDDPIAKAGSLLMFLSLGLMIHGTLATRIGTARALCITAATLGTPVILRWSATGTADIALATFGCGGAIFLAQWSEHQRWGDLIAAGLFFAMAAMTKNEGIALAAIAGAIAVIFAVPFGIRGVVRRCRTAACFAAIVLTIALPWLWWCRSLPRTDEDYLGAARVSTMIHNANRLPTILAGMVADLTSPSRWGLLFIALAMATIVTPRAIRHRAIAPIWLLLIGQFAVYVIVYVITPWSLDVLMANSTDRLMFHLSPFAGLLIGQHWAAALADDSPELARSQ